MKYVVRYLKPDSGWKTHGGRFSDLKNARAQADWYELKGYRVQILKVMQG